MNANLGITMVVVSAVTGSILYGVFELTPKTAPKGNRIIASPPVSVQAPTEMAQAPAATALAPPTVPAPPKEPVAAGPAPAESAPPKAVTVSHFRKPSKRRARRIAKAKAEPCVGPLCVLVAARR